jgi:hypothetical protein
VEEEAGVSHQGQASARQEEVEEAHNPVLLFAHLAHDNDWAQPLSQVCSAFLVCMSLDIAPPVAAALPLDQHTSAREASVSWNAASFQRVSDTPDSIRLDRTADCWCRCVQVCHSVLRWLAHSGWTGLRKRAVESVSSRASGRPRYDCLQIFVASPRSLSSSLAHGTRLRRGTIWPVLTSFHNTRLRRCRLSCTTS